MLDCGRPGVLVSGTPLSRREGRGPAGRTCESLPLSSLAGPLCAPGGDRIAGLRGAGRRPAGMKRPRKMTGSHPHDRCPRSSRRTGEPVARALSLGLQSWKVRGAQPSRAQSYNRPAEGF